MVGRCCACTAGLALITILLSGALPSATSIGEQDSQPSGRSLAPTDNWDTVTFDVTIQHDWLRADGSPSRPPQRPISYRWERGERGRGWKTTMTLRSDTRLRVTRDGKTSPIENPFEIVRYEDDGDGTPPRLFNARGEEVRFPAPGSVQTSATDRGKLAALLSKPEQLPTELPARPRVHGRDWIENLIIREAKRQTRLDSFTQRLRSTERRDSGAGTLRPSDSYECRGSASRPGIRGGS